MPITDYHKLVRDRIPELIELSGKDCVTEIIPEESYLEILQEKLVEEVNEYLAEDTLEELADIGEVIHAILAFKKIPVEEFQRVRQEKLASHGGFQKRILLKEVVEK